MRARDLESIGASSSTTAKHNGRGHYGHPTVDNDAHDEDRNARRPTIRMIVLRGVRKLVNVKGMLCLSLVLAWFLMAQPAFQRAMRKRRWFQFVKSTYVQEATQNRHQCIAAIRKKHNAAILELVQKEEDGGPQSILLVDPAYHKNVGDHMLTVGEQTFLQRSGWNNSILECEYVQSAKRVPLCTMSIPKMSKQAKVALWHAGGNWGDLWVRAQRARIDSFSELLLAGFSIVGMPQSLYYKNQTLKTQHTAEIKRKIMRGLNLKELQSFESRAVTRSRLTFTWREQRSYAQAKEMYPFATNKLVPDIAFQLGPFEPIRPEKYEDLVDIVVFLRDDKESVYANERNRGSIQKLLNNIPGGKGLTFIIVDWWDRLKIFGTTNENFDQTSVRLMSMGKIVICDRLHASILSYVSGVPFVYVDQVSNKLTNTLNVAFSSWEGCQNEHGSMLTRATSLQDALLKSVEFLDEHDLI